MENQERGLRWQRDEPVVANSMRRRRDPKGVAPQRGIPCRARCLRHDAVAAFARSEVFLAHCREGIFEVKLLHLEPSVVVDDALVAEVKAALRACAAWHKTPQVVVRYATKPGLAKRLSEIVVRAVSFNEIFSRCSLVNEKYPQIWTGNVRGKRECQLFIRRKQVY
jgi:hypothetical protein